MIAVISDSHVPRRQKKIPEAFRDKMKNAELTIHAGDFTDKEVYNRIKRHGELVAVKGNCDFFDLPNSETFERNKLEFGVYHGTGITPRGNHETLQKIAAEDLDVDVLITGHTHQEEISKLDKCVILNPGSCTGASGGSARRGNPTMIEILEKDQRSLKATILEIKEDEIISKETREFSP